MVFGILQGSEDHEEEEKAFGLICQNDIIQLALAYTYDALY